MKDSDSPRTAILLYPVIAILVAFIAYGSYEYYLLKIEYKEITLRAEDYENQINTLNSGLSEVVTQNGHLSQALYTEQNKNALFEEQIKEIAGTVGVLEKLSKTDPELLQKYSKIYFLNENYRPETLTQISPEYVLNGKEQWIHAKVWPFLEKLLKDAKKNGGDLLIVSSFRTFDEQASVKESHVIIYGAGTANQFSAEQGYSEHQLGTTVDFTTPEIGSNYSGIKNTESYEWLESNAYRYGFILSYPEINDYYIYEPWHWRFVGAELATKLHQEGKYFYDLDQREIDEYLVSIFD